MNIVLWILQVLLGLAFVAAGYNKGFNTEKAKVQQGMQWMSALSPHWLTFIAVSEILGGVGLVLPAATNILPWLTPLAGALLALVMVLAIVFHLPRREYPNIIFNVILLALAAFVAYGRFALAPL